MLVSVIKRNIQHGSYAIYMGLYAIGMWDRNWKLPDDLFLIEHLYNILRLRMTNVEV